MKLMIVAGLMAVGLAACGSSSSISTVTVTSSAVQSATHSTATTQVAAASNPNSTNASSPAISCTYSPASMLLHVKVTAYGARGNVEGDYNILDSQNQPMSDDRTIGGSDGVMTASLLLDASTGVAMTGQFPYKCLLVDIATLNDNVASYIYNDQGADGTPGNPGQVDSGSVTTVIPDLH